MLLKSKVRFAWCYALSFVLCSMSNAAQWVQTWGAAPLPPAAAFGPFPATPSFNNQTIRQTVHVSAGGARIRIRFTNEYGTKPLAIGAAQVALSDEKGNIQPGTSRPVLFSGQTSVSIPPAAPFVSDPVGVIDFDAVMRDPDQPTQIRNGFHMGDHVHGNDAGYAAMAAAVDLSLLK